MFEHAKVIFSSALKSVMPSPAMFQDGLSQFGQSSSEEISVIGVGKAAMSMASSFSAVMAVKSGHLTVPTGYADGPFAVPDQFQIVEADHPVPGENSRRAVESLLEFMDTLAEDQHVIVLISGGGSSLWGSPIEGVASNDYREVIRRLSESNLPIDRANAIRSMLACLSGGGLLGLIGRRRCAGYVLSDVPGDNASVVASGPLSPPGVDSHDLLASNLEAIGVQEKLRGELIKKAAAKASLLSGLPMPKLVTVGNSQMAIEAAASAASALGYHVNVYPNGIKGEARQVGSRIVHNMRSKVGIPTCSIYGGESTVSLIGNGLGGRNQELALSSAIALNNSTIRGTILAVGTDGIDGPTKAAGAIVNDGTVEHLSEVGRIAEDYLDNNDSFSYFESTSYHLIIGPTHTNVMDLVISLQS